MVCEAGEIVVGAICNPTEGAWGWAPYLLGPQTAACAPPAEPVATYTLTVTCARIP